MLSQKSLSQLIFYFYLKKKKKSHFYSDKILKNSENIRETDSDQTRYFLKAVFFHLKVKLAGANESKKFFSEDEMVGGGDIFSKIVLNKKLLQ